jgi:putative transcriptional regulator
MARLLDKSMTTGEKLIKLRGKKTKSEVAEAIGVSESSYIKYERDERNPSDIVKQRIADYYGRKVGSIFFSYSVHKCEQGLNGKKKRPPRPARRNGQRSITRYWDAPIIPQKIKNAIGGMKNE